MIEEKAHGTIPNKPLPSSISQEGITSFKLIAFNELFEVAFFTQLLHNITNNVPGYEFSSESDREYATRVIRTIQGVSVPSPTRAVADST